MIHGCSVVPSSALAGESYPPGRQFLYSYCSRRGACCQCDKRAVRLVDADGMAQLSQGPRLDVPDAFARHVQLVRQFFEGVDAAVAQSVAVLDDAALLGLEDAEDLAE